MGWLTKRLVRIIRHSLEPSPERKGELGEQQLRRAIERIYRRRHHHFLHDLTIPDYDGTAQVDHVLVTAYGVFVIETKNYKGWIFGSERQRTWTQTFRTRKHRFQNPLRQNYNHLKAIQALTQLPASAMHSLVVFVGSAEFRTPMPANVTDLHGLRGYFAGFTQRLLSESEMAEALERIVSGRLLPGAMTDLRHRAHLEEVRANPVCSRCGKAMVLRTAKTGANAGREFWGCSGFPKCRGTKAK